MKVLFAFLVLSSGVSQAGTEEAPLICYVSKPESYCFSTYRVSSRVEEIQSFPFAKSILSESPEEQYCISTYGSQWVEENANLPRQDLAFENALLTANQLKYEGYCKSVIIVN